MNRQKVYTANPVFFFTRIVLPATLLLLTPFGAVNGQSQEAPRPAASDQTATDATRTQHRSDYLIGPGDVLDIRLLNSANSKSSTLFTVVGQP